MAKTKNRVKNYSLCLGKLRKYVTSILKGNLEALKTELDKPIGEQNLDELRRCTIVLYDAFSLDSDSIVKKLEELKK
jgi:hypothetical protein